MESQLEKEARFCQLMAHSSHDSAIDTDSLEWETEVVEFEKDRVRAVHRVHYRAILCHHHHLKSVRPQWLKKKKVITKELTESVFQDDMDLKALGFDIAEGVNDPYLPGDCGIFVTRVDKGSVADGRLRYELPREANTHFSLH